jgi:hypothetical protein
LAGSWRRESAPSARAGRADAHPRRSAEHRGPGSAAWFDRGPLRLPQSVANTPRQTERHLSNHAAETGPAVSGVTGGLGGLSDGSARGEWLPNLDLNHRHVVRRTRPDA